jgi:heptosyltransferase II
VLKFMQRPKANGKEVLDVEASARAIFLKMTPRKWRIVRAFEFGLRMFCRLFGSPNRLIEQGTSPESILIVEYWNLGDLAILVPFLRNLRQTFPTARIALLVNAGLATFLDGQGLVDEFIPVRVPWAQHFIRWKKYNPFSGLWTSFVRTMFATRKKRFEWAFSGRMDIRDNLMLWLCGAPRRIGYGFAGGGFLLTDCVLPDVSRPHRTDVWLNLLKGLGYSIDQSRVKFRLSNEETNFADTYLRERGIAEGTLLVGVHPGARIPIRRWGDDRVEEVAASVLEDRGTHVVWFSDPSDPSQPRLSDRCHAASLEFRKFLAVLSRCHLLICNDSGPMHLANLLGVPVLAVFGSTNPVWFGPRADDDRIVIRSEFWCRPCFDYCIYDQPYCLRTISPETVIRSAKPAVASIRESMWRSAERSTGVGQGVP